MIQAASKRPEFCADFVQGRAKRDADVAEIQSVARRNKREKQTSAKGSGNAFKFRFVNVFAKVERKST